MRQSSKQPLSMESGEFEEFYSWTAKPLKRYLLHLISNDALADELLQESYYRLLRADTLRLAPEERKSYLFRVATNLVNDMHRGKRESNLPLLDNTSAASLPSPTAATEVRRDVQRALGGLKLRERELVWLAYAEGASHREIAGTLGVKEDSVRPMLFRAKQKLLELLQPRGAE